MQNSNKYISDTDSDHQKKKKGVLDRDGDYYLNHSANRRLCLYKVIVVLQFHHFPWQVFNARDMCIALFTENNKCISPFGSINKKNLYNSSSELLKGMK